MTKDVTLETMHLVTFDLVPVPSKTTSEIFATTKPATGQCFLLLPSVISYSFNTFCRVKFIPTVSCGDCLTERKKHKFTWNSPRAFQNGVHKNSYPSASRRERIWENSPSPSKHVSI